MTTKPTSWDGYGYLQPRHHDAGRAMTREQPGRVNDIVLDFFRRP
jgi:hypothetical protein